MKFIIIGGFFVAFALTLILYVNSFPDEAVYCNMRTTECLAVPELKERLYPSLFALLVFAGAVTSIAVVYSGKKKEKVEQV